MKTREEALSLTNLADGVIVDRFNRELAEVLANIDDPNCDPKTTRKITIEVTLKSPKEESDLVDVGFVVNTKLAPFKPGLSVAVTDGKTAREIIKNNQNTIERTILHIQISSSFLLPSSCAFTGKDL